MAIVQFNIGEAVKCNNLLFETEEKKEKEKEFQMKISYGYSKLQNAYAQSGACDLCHT